MKTPTLSALAIGAALATGLAAGLAADLAAAAEPLGRCAALDAEVDRDAIRDCQLERERLWGPDDARLLPFYAAAAAAFAADDDAAIYALPFRRRAYELAGRLHGDSVETADAALAYARTWILSGRCTAMDPRIEPLVASAARGYAALPASSPERSEGLRAAAHAFADGLRFGQAAATMLLIAPEPTGPDWERIGRWRGMSGDLAGAAEATRAAYDAAEDGHDRMRLKATLKRLYFQLGDVGAATRLEAGE